MQTQIIAACETCDVRYKWGAIVESDGMAYSRQD